MPLLILSPLLLLLAIQVWGPAQNVAALVPMPLSLYVAFSGVAVLALLMRQWSWLYWLALLAGHHFVWQLLPGGDTASPGTEVTTIVLALITSGSMAVLAALQKPQLPTVAGFLLLAVMAALPFSAFLAGSEPARLLVSTWAEALPDTLAAVSGDTVLLSFFLLQGLIWSLLLYRLAHRSAEQWGQFSCWLALILLYQVMTAGTTNASWAALIACLIILLALSMQMLYLAYVDELTQLPQRRALQRHLKRLGKRSAVTMLDVDHFKKFNDRYGHDVGDQVLRLLGAILGRERGVTAYRYGGEEFTLVFTHNDKVKLKDKLEHIREKIASYPLEIRQPERPNNSKQGKQMRGVHRPAKQVKITISLGCAIRQSGEAPDALLKRADKALYAAKKAGRNHVILRS